MRVYKYMHKYYNYRTVLQINDNHKKLSVLQRKKLKFIQHMYKISDSLLNDLNQHFFNSQI